MLSIAVSVNKVHVFSTFRGPFRVPRGFCRIKNEYVRCRTLWGNGNYVDFTSYSDGTDPYHPNSGTERSVGSPSATPLGSDVEESPRTTFLREAVLAPHRTQEWVLAQQLDSPPGISRRRPGVTFEESPIVHIVPPSSPETPEEPHESFVG